MSLILNTLKSKQELFDLFTLREEYNPKILDRYNRFSYSFSKNHNALKPWVSKYLFDNGLDVKYPDSEEYAVCLTHDIDVLHFDKMHIMKEIYASWKIKNLKKIRNVLISSFSKKYNPLWNIKDIINLEKEYGAQSTFYFLGINKNNLDYNYDIEELRHDLHYILDSKFEVGLHGSHVAYDDYKSLMNEKTAIEKVSGKEITGFRNHFLRFKVPDTWENIAKAKIEYDTTLAYADCLGFRNGMCYPFRPYNLNTEELINILEIPLIIMDFTIDRYMQIKSDYIWPTLEMIIKEVKACKGVLTILWHNTYLDGEYKRLYKKILSYCRNQKAWITSAENIAKWWKENNYFGL